MPYHAFSSTGEIIQHIAATFGMELKLLEARLQREWAHVVGTPLASHTRPGSIKFRKLTVMTENSVWLQQLVFLKSLLLKRVNEFTGGQAITDLSFYVGEMSPAPSRSATNPPKVSGNRRSPQPPESAVTAAARVTQMLQHDDLRHAMTTLIAKALAASLSQ